MSINRTQKMIPFKWFHITTTGDLMPFHPVAVGNQREMEDKLNHKLKQAHFKTESAGGFMQLFGINVSVLKEHKNHWTRQYPQAMK